MPPKKETKKLTKKELLELKRAEERKKQEEELRIKDENERKRIEDERIKKEYEEKLAEEERQRLKEEYDGDVRSWDSEYFLHLTKNEKRLKEMQDWEKTLKCDPMPDPEYEKELTSYITAYADPIKMQNLQIKPILEAVQYAQEIISRLNTTLMKAYSDEDYKRVNWCKEYLLTLQNISNSKIDESTAELVLNNDVLISLKQAEQLKKQKEPQKIGKSDLPNQKVEVNINHAFKDVRYGLWINPNSKVTRYRPVDFGENGVQVELPRALQMSTLIMRVFWNAKDTFSKPDVYSKDIILGGVLDVVWYTLPPPPKPVGSIWTLKQEFDQEGALQRISYPSVDPMGQFTNATSFKVIYTLPPYVYLTQNDKIRVALYDAKAGWIHDNIEDIKYDFDKKQLQFTTIRLAPYAFVQERATDFPYTSWKLRCVSEDRLLLDIQGDPSPHKSFLIVKCELGKRQSFKFEIGPGYAILRDRNESELAHLTNQKLPPYQLLSELSKCGIHLLPVDEDALTNGLTLKAKETEDAAIRDICFAMRSFYIKSSRWNMQLTYDKVMVRIRENLEYDEEFAEDQEKDWKSVCWWPNKCAVVKARESYESLNENFVNDTVAHANLELLLRKHELTEPEATYRFREFKFIHFMQTVQRFFKLTRLLSFSLQ